MSGPTSPLLRRITAQAVLDALLDAPGALPATGVMSATGLSRPTVHAVCDELIARGWIAEEPPPRTPGPGRRARFYAALPRAGHVLAVDMGATTVRAAVADLRGAVVGEATVVFRHRRVPAAERVAVTREACAAALDSAAVPAPEVLGAALGVPAPVTSDGRAAAADRYLPGLAELDLRAVLAPLVSTGTDAPVLVENDANLAVIAERWLGAAAGCDDVVLVLSGERLGAGVCLGGRVLRGHRGGTGEMGFLDLVVGVGDAEAIGSLARRWGSVALGRPVQAEEVFAAARRGDPAATGVLDAVARRVARALAVLATLLDPELVVVGGAVAGAADVLLEPLGRELRAAAGAPVRLAASGLADRGVLLGAVRVALDRVRPGLLDLTRR